MSGYPSLIIIGYCYLAAWCGVRLGRGWTARRVATLSLFVAVSVGVLLPAYLGFLQELRGYTDRQQALPRENAITAQALDPKALATFASPYVAIAATMGSIKLWPTDVAMCSIYLAPLVMVLGVSSLLGRGASLFRWGVASIGLACLAASLGDTLPVRGWLYDLLPPMRYFHHAAAFRLFFIFTLTMLAAMAARDLQDAARQRDVETLRRTAFLSLLLAVAALATLAVVLGAAHLRFKDVGLAVLSIVHAGAIWLGCAVMLIRAWLLAQGGQTCSFARPALALAVADAVLTVILSRPAMYTDRREYWTAIENRASVRDRLDPQRSAAAAKSACLSARPYERLSCQQDSSAPLLQCTPQRTLRSLGRESFAGEIGIGRGPDLVLQAGPANDPEQSDARLYGGASRRGGNHVVGRIRSRGTDGKQQAERIASCVFTCCRPTGSHGCHSGAIGALRQPEAGFRRTLP